MDVAAQRCTVRARDTLRASRPPRHPAAGSASTGVDPHRLLLPSLLDRRDKRFRQTSPLPRYPEFAHRRFVYAPSVVRATRPNGSSELDDQMPRTPGRASGFNSRQLYTSGAGQDESGRFA